ncbi:hypothetical protein CHUAL_007547 [Chamberlinius hualienensis]
MDRKMENFVIIYFLLCVPAVISTQMTCFHNDSIITINMDFNNETCKLLESRKFRRLSYRDEKFESSNSSNFATWDRMPCQPNPCLYGSRCRYNNTEDDYYCDRCPTPMGGKNCSEIACDTTCFRLNDTVYFIYTNNSDKWNESYHNCAVNNLSMAVIKDKKTHRFLQNYLNKQNHSNYNLPIGYWIGLNRSADCAPWTWVDGSRLKSNEIWFRTHRRFYDNLCAILVKSDVINYELVSRPCATPFYWTTFTLCQKRFPFLKDGQVKSN